MKKLLFFLVTSIVSVNLYGQDPQFSQFYAAPMYHNPAFTGSGYAPRMIFNFRNQWPSLSANFTTSTISVDHYLERFNSGVGLMVLTDQQGAARLKNTEISGFYSYQLNLIDDHFLRLGAQATRSVRGFNTNGLTFPDQFDNNGFNGSPTNDPLAGIESNAQFMDFSTGILYYNPRAYLGVSVHHLTEPDLGLTAGSNEVLQRKYMVNGGLNIPLRNPSGVAANADREFTFIPTFLYKQQGKFSQLDLGAYVTYSPLTVGLWYRGIPIKKNGTNSVNHDALVALAGFRLDQFSFGYSYDLTISSLGTTSGGAHEISVAYQFEAFESERNPHVRRRKKALSCPKF
ncbi:PorP/SprF family type IX secretion system membrane protein [Jiulongibacter sp. NS-SX5]|uniref:PorP/SprF family type IX secretion system membrane protein n=1 Tax=Jiulongibacter sp. NS-SX5 TaxID=3463854 RepID=UPI004059A592